MFGAKIQLYCQNAKDFEDFNAFSLFTTPFPIRNTEGTTIILVCFHLGYFLHTFIKATFNRACTL